ncbi:pentatricopeptide repeat-containing protein At5g39350-like [Phalaenopsis equestris]|uniref:pentatricopeptide repeat-containing protein At5g39350-like n=1 Tax=Phalaenopsis equestris TaxID=78828 RepID=UPI0009E54C04|nr:pentatricopeptide repeat-containing protein At5g39350-like [Phalaenopsis equestris]XP_020596128.1 pentatricopeptide repeat-containing protein At5g39350-like [Phalaenopsis equestris]
MLKINSPSHILDYWKKSRAPLFFTIRQCISLLQSYARRRSLCSCKHLHALLISSGVLLRHPLLLSTLTATYSLCGHFSHAHQLFDKIPLKSPSLFNVLIRSSVDAGFPNESLRFFTRMQSSHHRPNNFTYPFVLKACGELSLLTTGVQVHCRTMVEGFSSNEYVQNCLIDMYMNCHNRDAATIVFDQMGCRSVISWNTMIAGCLQNGFATEAMVLFERMVSSGMLIDRASLLSVLPVCAELKDLRSCWWVHKLMEVNGFESYLPVRNALIDTYAKCGRLDVARRLFDESNLERDVICWTAMIGGYVLNGCMVEALSLSHEMQLSDIRPNSMTISSLLTACGNLPSEVYGVCLHGLCIKIGLETDAFVETALIDMYSKCGEMDLSLTMFVSSSKKTATWNAIISGFARNRMMHEATEQFKLMLWDGIMPDVVTMRSLLPAYSSPADLQQAKNIHGYLLKTAFLENIEPMTCLIDSYAKIGCLDIARELFDGLPAKDLVVWSVIIAGYGTHGQSDEAICLFDQMLESGVEPSEVTFTSVLYTCSHAGLVEEGLRLFDRMTRVHGMKPTIDHGVCLIDLLSRAGRLEEAYMLTKEMPYKDNYAMLGALLGACVVHENVELGEMAAKRLFEIQPENTGNYVLLGNIYAAVGRWREAEAVRSMASARGLRKEKGCSSIDACNP